MAYHHQSLADGRWQRLSRIEQLAHIGSEVERALNWRRKGDAEYSRQALERALELFDLSLRGRQLGPGLKEVARLREVVCDFFTGPNTWQSSEASLRAYFYPFTYAARRDR